MTDVSLWQQGLEQSDVSFDPHTIATDLYQCSRQLFLGILEDPEQASHHDFLHGIRHQMQRFSLWGSGFDAEKGGLDERLVGADRLKEVLLPLLGSLGETLVAIAERLGKGRDLAGLCSRVQHLKAHISDSTKRGLGGNDSGDALLPEALLDELDSSNSDNSSVDEVIGLQELLQDIRSYNTCLFRLSSVLQEPAESISIDLGKSEEEIEVDRDMLAHTAWPYISSVIKAYPLMNRELARRLGEANELRYTRLQSKRDKAAARDTGLTSESSSDDVASTVRPSQGIGQASSSLAQSESTAPSTRLSSVFNHARETTGRKMYAKSTIAASVTTFESGSGGKGAESSSRGIPKMPEDQPWGTPFRCSVCGETLSNVWSPAQWVKHVYRDLQPYSCSFPNCSSENETFTSRREWANHEFSEHRRQAHRSCSQCDMVFENKADLRRHLCQFHVNLSESQVKSTEHWAEQSVAHRVLEESCPFCLNVSSFTVKEFISHVGMHMQQVACAAIPLSAMSNDTEVAQGVEYDEFEEEDEDTKGEEVYDEIEDIHGMSLTPPVYARIEEVDEQAALEASNEVETDKQQSAKKPNVKADLTESFKKFAIAGEKRLEKDKRKSHRDIRSADILSMKGFSAGFEIGTPVPRDLLPILAKDPARQKELANNKSRTPPVNASTEDVDERVALEASNEVEMDKQQSAKKPNVEADVTESFERVARFSEKRLEKDRRKSHRDIRSVDIRGLKTFSKRFKIGTPVPNDLLPILAKEPARQEELAKKAEAEAFRFEGLFALISLTKEISDFIKNMKSLRGDGVKIAQELQNCANVLLKIAETFVQTGPEYLRSYNMMGFSGRCDAYKSEIKELVPMLTTARGPKNNPRKARFDAQDVRIQDTLSLLKRYKELFMAHLSFDQRDATEPQSQATIVS